MEYQKQLSQDIPNLLKKKRKKERDAETERWLKSKGMIKEDEHVSDFERDPVTGCLNLNKKKKK